MKALFSWWLNDLLLSFFKPKFCKAVFKLILTKQLVNLEFFVADGSIKIVMSDGIVKHIIRTYVVKLSYDRLKNLKVDVSYCFLFYSESPWYYFVIQIFVQIIFSKLSGGSRSQFHVERQQRLLQVHFPHQVHHQRNRRLPDGVLH